VLTVFKRLALAAGVLETGRSAEHPPTPHDPTSTLNPAPAPPASDDKRPQHQANIASVTSPTRGAG